MRATFIGILFVLSLSSLTAGATSSKASYCSSVLIADPHPVDVILIDDNADYFQSGVNHFSEGSLQKLADALRVHRYRGPKLPEDQALRVSIFDVAVDQTLDVLTPVSLVRLGLRLYNGPREVKIRLELPYANLAPVDAVAQAVVDLLNHAELLHDPLRFNRELKMLRAQLTLLNARDLDPLINKTFITNALATLRRAPDIMPLLGSASTHLGRRYSAYFRARQMLVHAWTELDVKHRRELVKTFVREYQPSAPHAPAAKVLRESAVQDMATRGHHLLGRPWFFTGDRRAFYATLMWFEILARRSGDTFLITRFVGDLSAGELNRFDQPIDLKQYRALLHEAPTTAAPSSDEPSVADVADGSADQTKDIGPDVISPSASFDPTVQATGIPDPGGNEIGIGGVNPTDSEPGGMGHGI